MVRVCFVHSISVQIRKLKIGNRLSYFHVSTLIRSQKTETYNSFRDDVFSRTIKHWTYCFDISFRCDRNDRNGQFRSDFHPLKTADRTARRAPRAFPIFVKYEHWNTKGDKTTQGGEEGPSFWRPICRGGLEARVEQLSPGVGRGVVVSSAIMAAHTDWCNHSWLLSPPWFEPKFLIAWRNITKVRVNHDTACISNSMSLSALIV